MIFYMDQNTPEWYAARAGRITASRIADVLAYLKKGGESKARADYRADLVAERLTGKCEDCYVSREMQWGIDQEPFARARYEMVTGGMVERVGFITHPTILISGGSPDGLVNHDGVNEYKAPKTTTHVRWARAGVVPPEHEPQCMWNIACAEREWCDFSSFDPRIPELDLQLFTVRLYRDDKRIAELESEVRRFDDEVERELAEFRNMKGRLHAA